MFQGKSGLKSFFSYLPSSENVDWLLFWMFWMCWEGHCTIREPGERITDAVWSVEQPRRPKRSVAEHKTLAGMCGWIVAWREGPADPFSCLCQQLDFEFDTSSRWFKPLDEYISSVYINRLWWQKCGVQKLSCYGNMQVCKAGVYLPE